MLAMYFSAHQYPSLKRRPKAERDAIITAALKTIKKSYTPRGVLALLATVITMVTITKNISLDAPWADWRLWVGLAVGAVILYGWALYELNGPVYRAVEKYLADPPETATA